MQSSMISTAIENPYTQSFNLSKHDDSLLGCLNLNTPYSALPTSLLSGDYISDYWQSTGNFSDFDLFSSADHQEDYLLGAPSPTSVSGPGLCQPLDCIGSVSPWDTPLSFSDRRDTIASNSLTRLPSPSSSASGYADSSQESPVLEPREMASSARKRQKTSAYSSPTTSKAPKRLPHKEVERNYRDSLNQELEQLRLAVPMVGNLDTRNYSARPSKVAVLASAVDYINTLERHAEVAAREKEQLLQILQLERLNSSVFSIQPI